MAIVVARRALSIVWLLARIVVIVGCLAIIVAWRAFDVTPMAIVSGSMVPTIPVNGLIFVEHVPTAQIKTGDIITFNPPGPTPRVSHRVIKKERIGGEWYFTTKGDANPSADDWRTPASIKAGVRSPGVSYGSHQALRYVWGVPHLGHIASLTSHMKVRMALVFGSLAAILVLLLVNIWRDDTEQEAAPTAQEQKVMAL